jgi:hypothetical protein
MTKNFCREHNCVGIEVRHVGNNCGSGWDRDDGGVDAIPKQCACGLRWTCVIRAEERKNAFLLVRKMVWLVRFVGWYGVTSDKKK